MKLTIKQKSLAGIAMLLLILIVTNPSIQAFKEHVGSNTYSGLYRDKNFFVASVYRYHSREYVGVIGNFIKGGYRHSDVVPDTVRDTVNKIDITVLSYKERVYLALKENLKDFNESQEDFDNKIKDKNYAMKVYKALKDTLPDFNKTPDEFFKLINS